MHDKIPLTIYIRTHNEECRIGPVVKRALSTGAEVIVVDDGSIDRTQIIAREAGAIVFENKWEGGGKQKRFAEKMASNKWLLDLDADEILSHELVEELKKIFSNPPKQGLYKINYIIIPPFPKGAIWKHANSDWKCKLYHKEIIRIPDHVASDQFKVPKGIRVKKLKNPIYHYSFLNISHEIIKMDKTSTVRAEEYKLKPKLILIIRILFAYPFYFLKKFFKNKMYTAGLYGFSCAAVIALNRWFKDVKMYEKYLIKKGLNRIDDEQ